MALKGILLAISCSFISLFIHLILSYFRKTQRIKEPLILELLRQTRLLSVIWIITALIYILLFFRFPERINILINRLNTSEELISFAYGIAFYLFLSFIYLTIYYLVDRSVSATMLEIINNAASGKLTADEIKKIYNVEKKYHAELKGMLEGRFIKKEDDYYKNSFKGYLYAKVAGEIKKLLRLGPGG